MTLSLKEQYADFISKQIETKAAYLPTFQAWIERKKTLAQLKHNFEFQFDSKVLGGRVTMYSDEVTYNEALHDAKKRLTAIENRKLEERGSKTRLDNPLSEREQLLALIMKKDPSLEKIEKENAKLLNN
jgi:hypothetical protein